MRGIHTTLLLVGLFTVVATMAAPTGAHAFTLRSPQLVIPPTSSDGTTLQQYLNSIGQTINVETDQLDAQVWNASGISPTFNLLIELAGYAASNNLGVYNSNAGGTPTLFQLFPGAASAGWFVNVHFGGGNLTVDLYDAGSVFQGSTTYSGVDASSFGFYLQGPGGTFYSQDYRNGGGKPQMLTYAGTGVYASQWFECFEDLPMCCGSDGDFQDAILRLQSVNPTPTVRKSWGDLKAVYR
jgi:hypothetical protein